MVAPALSVAQETLVARDAAAKPRWRRWVALNSWRLRSMLLALLSIALFIGLWQILTANHVNLYVRFMNVPSPVDVFGSAQRAMRSPEFAGHVVTSCRRIALGFALAAFIAIPL